MSSDTLRLLSLAVSALFGAVFLGVAVFLIASGDWIAGGVWLCAGSLNEIAAVLKSRLLK